jgi:hypothetical protein
LKSTFPRIQIRTVEELLAGKHFEYPSHAASSWKQAAKAQAESTQQAMELG